MRKNKIGGDTNRRHRRSIRHPRLNYSHNIIKDDCIVIDYSKKQRPAPIVRISKITGHGVVIRKTIGGVYI